MPDSLGEPIDVVMSFERRRARPLSFVSGGCEYRVTAVNMIHSSRVGRDKLYHFSVSSDDNYFQLTFDTEHNAWFLSDF